MTVDVHTHYVPDILIDYLREYGAELGIRIEETDGVSCISYGSGGRYPVTKEFYDLSTRLRDMDAARIDRAVLSVSPVYFFYDIDKNRAEEICRLCNDWVYGFSRKCPERLACMAAVPMQDVGKAIAELERAHQKLGMNAVEIAPVINGKMMDDEEFFPFYEYCEKNGILLYLHPARTDSQPPYDRYHCLNLIGYVEETNWALVRMIFGGVFEKYPELKVLTSHGGGNFPYQFGRLLHGCEVRPEARVNVRRPLQDYLKNIYFDSITHWTPSLQFLADTFGADHVLMGTDYPYDMADSHPVESVDRLRLSEEEKQFIKSQNCLTLINLRQEAGKNERH